MGKGGYVLKNPIEKERMNFCLHAKECTPESGLNCS